MTKKATHVYFDRQLLAKIDEAAKIEKLSRSAYLAAATRHYMLRPEWLYDLRRPALIFRPTFTPLSGAGRPLAADTHEAFERVAGLMRKRTSWWRRFVRWAVADRP